MPREIMDIVYHKLIGRFNNNHKNYCNNSSFKYESMEENSFENPSYDHIELIERPKIDDRKKSQPKKLVDRCISIDSCINSDDDDIIEDKDDYDDDDHKNVRIYLTIPDGHFNININIESIIIVNDSKEYNQLFDNDNKLSKHSKLFVPNVEIHHTE